MNVVQKTIYFNKYCANCGFRYPDKEFESKLDDGCINSQILDHYCVLKNLEDEEYRTYLYSIPCKIAIRFCDGDYFKALVRKKDE